MQPIKPYFFLTKKEIFISGGGGKVNPSFRDKDYGSQRQGFSGMVPVLLECLLL